MWIYFHSFTCGFPVQCAWCVEKTSPSPNYGFNKLVKDWVIVALRASFLVFHSCPLAYVSVLSQHYIVCVTMTLKCNLRPHMVILRRLPDIWVSSGCILTLG